MTPLKRKFHTIFEKARRGKKFRDFERSMRQIRIRDQKIQISKDLLLGHHLGEYKLQLEELQLIAIASADGKQVTIEALVSIHKKYRG